MMKPNPAIFNIPAVVGWMIVLMVLIHLFRNVVDARLATEFLYRFAFIPARYGADFFPGGTPARYWSVLSYAFLHGNLEHLALNCLWMACFGSALARRFGPLRFLVIAVLGVAGGAAVHFVAMPNDATPMIGASAGVSAMMAGALRFIFVAGGPLAAGRSDPQSYNIAAPTLSVVLSNRSVCVFVIFWLAINLAMGFHNYLYFGAGAGIAWQAHIGGFLVGLLIFPLLDPHSVRPENSSI